MAAQRALAYSIAVAVWLGAGLSPGWYYTITYYGGVGWPMPLLETCGALVLYYFSVLNADTEIQAVHWMAVFPMAGLLWPASLLAAARALGLPAPAAHRTCVFFALAVTPILLPAPYLMWVCGQIGSGFAMERMLAVALRRGNVVPWHWLSPLYRGLALTALCLQWATYRRLFITRGLPAARHLGSSAVLYLLVCCVAGAGAAVPLRAWLE